ncbi:RNA-directed DNA polymerase [Burkholderia metallica]|uniref:antiviral reverse transcriptase Drt3a n=1 Tax=Burkholderia metallica TaxID=488729 RepID=UPI00157A310B|nr:antiviral reverse transcriptase Drt3a [Burkholderia metallica]NTZ88435.1 RNA-directed DNA polymerase [Burkholderia metallica]
MHNLFTEGGFARVLRAGDSRRFKVDLKNDREAIIQQAITRATDGAAVIGPINWTRVKNRRCASLKDYPQNLALRSICLYLTRRFKIFPRSRDSIIKEIIETLGDSTPMFIIRRDISSFYESIPISEVQDLLEFNTHLPAKIRNYLRSFFSTFCSAGKGVPRGVGLSAVISELAMRDLDLKVRQIPGVYKYFRYSDDILIFAHSGPLRVAENLFDLFKVAGFRFNDKKSNEVHVDCREKARAVSVSVEYLGYKFSFRNGFGDDRARKVDVSISDRKISKIKTRLICSLKRYKYDRNFSLLLDRVKFISSNYFAYRSGASSIKTSKFVKSGIFYNYHLCGQYDGLKRGAHGARELKALDGFYRSLIKGGSSEFSPLFASVAGRRRLKVLEEISFFKGYEKKMTVRFRPERVQQIKSAWHNV